jgi:subtilisin family serine protease
MFTSRARGEVDRMNTACQQKTPAGRRPATYLRPLAFLVLALVFALSGFAQDIADSAIQQIIAIEQMKQTFTPAEEKMSTNLVIASRLARHESVPVFVAKILGNNFLDRKGRVEVDIRATGTDVIANRITRSGGEVISHQPNLRHLRARVGLAHLLAMASDPGVQWIGEADQMTTNVGAVTSQGYISHRANQVVGLGITGSGVNIGVLSDSASPARVTALIASGDLPPGVTVLAAGTGTDEGAAMMEIVHDIAPGANLFFSTANGGQAAMAANIRTLRNTYHCDIIVDDITYFAESAFQDGLIAQAINDVVADGALYFSSAANSGNLTFGTSGTWEGDFLNGGAVSGPISGSGETGFFHNFGTAGSPQNFDALTAISSFISLKWSDPLAASANDYDLFILNSTGSTVKGFSAAVQSGTQNPFEAIQTGTGCGTATPSGYCPAVGDRVVVVLFSGSARALRVDTNRGRLSIATAGSTFGHNAGLNTISTAATYWNSAKTGTKPFVGVANPIETFSSDGPRKIFFNPNGTAITPGNFLFGTNGGTTLQKPDVTAADGNSAKTPGFTPFFGTSAAAPHAAGVAALVKSTNPTLTNTQIKQILIDTALDNMAPGADRDGGYGIVMALPAVQAAQAH